MWPRARRSTGSCPCLTAQLLEEMATTQQSTAGISGFPVRSPGRLSRRERLGVHVGTFLVVGWNLMIANLAHSPHHLWCWPWIGAWAVMVCLHGVVVAIRANHTGRPDMTSGPAQIASTHSSR